MNNNSENCNISKENAKKCNTKLKKDQKKNFVLLNQINSRHKSCSRKNESKIVVNTGGVVSQKARSRSKKTNASSSDSTNKYSFKLRSTEKKKIFETIENIHNHCIDKIKCE